MIALLVFGATKGRFTDAPVLRVGLQTLLIGGIAAGVAFAVGKMLGWMGRLLFYFGPV
ncbi:MAG: VIT1/CCC1 transporter family protein [Thermoflexales bacterium]|nr:VIT1/CCC1 transporter family protein [Thermoflexales bacterium]